MAKNKQVIPIPMTKGLDQGASPLLVQAGLLRLENGVFRKDGQISKVNGMSNVGTTAYNEDAMAVLKDRPVLLSSGSLKEHSDATLLDGTFYASDGLRVTNHTVDEIGGSRRVSSTTMVEVGNVRAIAYNEEDSAGTSTSHCRVYQIESGRLLSHSTYGTGNGIRLAASDTTIYMFYHAGTNQLARRKIDSAGTVDSELVLTGPVNVDSVRLFDACCIDTSNGVCLVAYKENVTMDGTVVTVDDDGTVHGPTTVVLTGLRDINCWRQANGVGMATFSDLTAGTYSTWLTAWDVAAGTLGTNQFYTHATDAPLASTGAPLSATTGMVYTGHHATVGGINPYFIRRHFYTVSGGTITPGVGQNLLWGFTTFCKPIVRNTTEHYLIAQPVSTTTDQHCFIMVRADGNAAGDNIHGDVYGRYLAGYGSYPIASLAGGEVCGAVAAASGDKWRVMLKGRQSDEYAGAVMAEIDMSPDSPMAIEGTDRLLIEGSVGYEFDGEVAFESNFLLYPYICAAVDSGAGPGGPGIGTYAYCLTYSFMDSAGCLHRSLPSPVSASLTMAGTNTVTVTCPTTSVHQKALSGDMIIEVWRTKDSGSYFYLCGEVSNNITARTVTFTDTVSDAVLTGNQALYRQPSGSTLGYMSPQPWSIGCLHQGRHCIVDMEQPSTRVLYSIKKVKREGYQWNDYLVIDVPRDGGAITGLQTFQDKLLIFKRDRIYATYGSGYDHVGSGSNYATPVLLSAASGCTEQKSIVQCPAGLMFAGVTGIWAVTPAMKVIPIGEGADYAFSQCTVKRGLLVTEQEYVVFLTTADAISYNYLTDTWGTFTWSPAEDGCVCMDGQPVFKRTGSANVVGEDSSLYSYLGAHNKMVIETGWLSPATASGWLRAYAALVGGHIEKACTLRVKFAYDGIPYWKDSQSLDLTTLGASPSDNQYGSGLSSSYEDKAMLVDFATSQQKVTSVKIHISDEMATPLQSWSDPYDGVALAPEYTELDTQGTITVTGGLMIQYAHYASGHYPLWTVGAQNPLAATYPLASAFTGGEGLWTFQSSFELTQTFAWVTHGIGILMPGIDDSYVAEVGSDGTPGTNQARVVERSGGAFITQAFDGLAAVTTPVLRVYWNNHPTDSFDDVNGESLARNKARAMVSRDGGANWTKVYATDFTLPTDPTNVILYTRVAQPGLTVETEFANASLTLTGSPSQGVTVDFIGLEVGLGKGLMRLGSGRKA